MSASGGRRRRWRIARICLEIREFVVWALSPNVYNNVVTTDRTNNSVGEAGTAPRQSSDESGGARNRNDKFVYARISTDINV
jgi:hypothetical protein